MKKIQKEKWIRARKMIGKNIRINLRLNQRHLSPNVLIGYFSFDVQVIDLPAFDEIS